MSTSVESRPSSNNGEKSNNENSDAMSTSLESQPASNNGEKSNLENSDAVSALVESQPLSNNGEKSNNDDDDDDDDDDIFKSLNSLQTGDLLLYRTTDLGATFNAVAQGSYFSHVSLIVRGDRNKLEELYPDDYKTSCCGENDTTDDNDDNNNKKKEGGDDDDTKEGNKEEEDGIAIFEVVPNRGVCVFPVIARLARTIKSIRHLNVRRRVGIDVSDENQIKLYTFMKEVIGRNLEILSFDLFRALLFNRCKCSQQVLGSSCDEDWEEFFCSELVAEGLQQLGIIRDDVEVKSNLLIPSSFADPYDRKKMRHSGAFDFCHKKICLPGHNFLDSELLIKKHNKMYYDLKEEKKSMMKEKSRVAKLQKFENSKNKKKNNNSSSIRRSRFSTTVRRK
jgi:hypothetical protein